MKTTQGLNVLLVGDRREFVQSLCCPLRSNGHQVEITPDASAALTSARNALPDVVFFDWDSPGLDVPNTAKSIHDLATWRHPFFIALADRDNPETTQPISNDGIDLHVLKPLKEEQLLSLLLRFQTLVREMESFDPII